MKKCTVGPSRHKEYYNTSCNKYFMSATNTKKLEEKISWRTNWKPVSTDFCQSFIYPKIVRTGTAYWGHEAEPDQKQFSRTGSGPVRFRFFLVPGTGLENSITTAYHPQSDGATERINQEIEVYLSIYCTSHPEDWLHSLSTLEFTHNNRRHAEWIHSPFKLMQGNNPIFVPITFSHTKFPTIEEKMKHMISDREEVLAAHELARTRIANRKQSKFIPFEKDQKVWLDMRNLKMSHHKKIAPKREGPFEIDEVLGPVTYWLKLPESWKIHNVFHATLLQPYIENEVYGNNYPRPLPKLLEGEEVYKVEMILKHWRRGRGYQYYVKWKGYPITEATWENKSAFSNDGDMIQLYKDRYQL
jgi:hypothetical protein